MKNQDIIEKYYYPVRRWIINDAKYLHYDVYYGFKNLFYWFKIIWKTREWDESYMFEIEQHKLKAMSKLS